MVRCGWPDWREISDQGQTIYFGHNEVLKNNCRLDPACQFDCLGRVLAEVEIDILLRGQHASHSLTDHGLVINKQNSNSVMCQGGWLFIIYHLYAPSCPAESGIAG